MPITGSAQLVNVRSSGRPGVGVNPVGARATGIFQADAFQADAFALSGVTAGITGWSCAVVVKGGVGVPGLPAESGIWGRSEAIAVRGSSFSLPYRSAGWKYQVVAHDALPGFEAPGYDDSSWATGTAAFGGGLGGCPLDSTIATSWPTNTDCLLRRHISFPDGATNVKVWFAIDNDAYVYWNGVGIYQVGHEGCAALDDFSFVVPDTSVIVGDNHLAMRAIDRGVVSYVDLRITADLLE